MSQQQMRTDLRTFILNDGAISALIGTKFFASMPRAGQTVPYMVSTVVGAELEYNHDGKSNGQVTRMQFDIHAETVSDAEALSDLLKARLSGYTGTANDTHFGSIFESGTETDNFQDTPGKNGEPVTQRKTIDFHIAWQTAASL